MGDGNGGTYSFFGNMTSSLIETLLLYFVIAPNLVYTKKGSASDDTPLLSVNASG